MLSEVARESKVSVAKQTSSFLTTTISMEFSAEMQSICLSLSNAALILLLKTFSLFLKTLVFYVIFSSSVGFCKLRTLVQL